MLGLAVLAATFAATASEALQVVSLFALVGIVFPLLLRFLSPGASSGLFASSKSSPAGAIAASFGFLLPWAGVVFLTVPGLELGPWFAWWVVMWPWSEVLGFLAARRRDGHGGGKR